jgi:hypothetical protein
MKASLLRALALVAITALALTGCAKLPTDSEVKVGSDIQSGLTADYLYYSPSGPDEAATQQEIINGFINAATGPQNDYQVAREYLSRDLAAKWNPSAELLVGDSRPVIEVMGSTEATVTFKAVARVDELGRYQELAPSISRILKYSMIEEDGQWRINQAPDSIVLVRPVFEVLFRSYSLYFYDNQDRYLVPDSRWFATRISTGTRLVSALLAGPDYWLTDAVNSAFPTGTQLALDSVTVDAGTAIVDLDASVNSTTVAQRQRMLVQLTSTLTQLPNVFSVQIKIDGVLQNIVNLPYQVSLAKNPDPIVLTSDGFRQLSTSAVPMKRASEAAKDWQANEFGINNQQTLLALTGPQGIAVTRLTGANSELTAIDYRGDLLAPVIDPQGLIWCQGASADSPLTAYDSTGKQVFSTLGWLSQANHVTFSISREGSRVAFLLNYEGQFRLYVAAIVRDEKGNPVAISVPVRMAKSELLTGSVSWIDETTVASISRSSGSITSPVYLQVGGQVKKLAPVPSAQSVVSSGIAAASYALDSKQELRILRSLTWINIARDILAIHFAG